MGAYEGPTNFLNVGAAPSLMLNFAREKSLEDQISGKDLITFLRSSVGTYVGADGLIKTAAADEPRFDHDPVTGESLGLLIEEQRTNLYDNTTNFGSSNWALQTSPEVTLNTTDVLSPDGTFNAVKWTPTTTLSQYVYDQVGNLGSSLTYTMSVWVRTPSGESTTFQMNLFSPTQLSPVFTATDTWKRFTWTFTPQSQSTAYPVIVRELNKSLYIWGPQIEVGSFATSYIPTDAFAVTRQPDIAQITGTNFTDWYNATEGTIYCSAIGREADDYYWSISNNTTSTLLLSQTNFDLFVNNGGSTQAAINTGTTANIQTKVASAYKANNFAAVKNNQTLGTDTSGSIPTVDRLRLGTHGNGTNELNGHLKQLIYYPARISDIKLQQMTKVFS